MDQQQQDLHGPRSVHAPLSVLCVDDNVHVADALKLKLGQIGGFEWKGWLSCADALLAEVSRLKPSILILDLDMPHRNPFEALTELSAQRPDVRAVVFSGHVSFELINKALEAGAWGYVSKNDGDEALIKALHAVASDELAFSAEVQLVYDRN